MAKCVQSALASSEAVEIFVVDNASQDDSFATLRQQFSGEGRLQLLESKQNLGFAKAANLILPLTQGEYILFLNPDCLLKNDTLTRLRTAMARYPQAGMAGPLALNPDGTEQTSSRRSVPDPWRALLRVLHLSKFFPNQAALQDFLLTRQVLPQQPVFIEGISGACMFVRRQALETVGKMDETYYLHCEDLDWFMRFRAQGWQILFVPDAQVTHFQGACSIHEPLRVLWYKHRGMLLFYRKFFRQRYPSLLYWAVTAAVWGRFAFLAILTVFKGFLPKKNR